MLVGIIVIPAGGLGTFTGGYITKRFRLTRSQVIKMYIYCQKSFLIGFLLNKFGPKKSNYIIILSMVFLISIMMTGERSNTLRAGLGILIFFIFYKEFNLRFKLISLITMVLLLFILISNSAFLKGRFIVQFKQALTNDGLYLRIYKSGFEVFKNYPLFGVGNKNYRIETCKNQNNKSIKTQKKYKCTTHPHQIYLEFLSEHGLLGSLMMFFILYKLIFIL